jgi:hypothetical protein
MGEQINLFRVAFLLERMCPLKTGLGPVFDEVHFGHFKDAVDYITIKKGACAFLSCAPSLEARIDLLADRLHP